ncbi:hypothetical protein FGO68_gene9061 [Halteria grandinella]|uniref:Uncharacterized protein n=1 Tax=Halteria grandinella TaxID=5974 RepID=A0A8J8P054_HALGN|nr:hypothetical protein FGO68_gene9061 [Halteria grandinella]
MGIKFQHKLNFVSFQGNLRINTLHLDNYNGEPLCIQSLSKFKVLEEFKFEFEKQFEVIQSLTLLENKYFSQSRATYYSIAKL